jgi:hypothetical protein
MMISARDDPLFAALNVLDGTVIDQSMARHRHRNSSASPTASGPGKRVHAILDNYAAAHKHPQVRAWLARHRTGPFISRPPAAPRSMRSTPFSPALTCRRLQRGVFHSLVDLQAAINRYLGEDNRKPKPFV